MQAGVGGPGLGSLESYPLWSVDSAAAKNAFALSYDLNALERRARLLATSLDEATDSLQAHQDLLESTPSILPTSGLLSSRFSKSRMHPIHNRPLPHEGIDIAAPKGTPIFAAAKGRVVRAGWVSGYGLTVEIDHGYGYTTLYGHASKLLVRLASRSPAGTSSPRWEARASRRRHTSTTRCSSTGSRRTPPISFCRTSSRSGPPPPGGGMDGIRCIRRRCEVPALLPQEG